MSDEAAFEGFRDTAIGYLRSKGVEACPSCGSKLFDVHQTAVIRQLAYNPYGPAQAHFVIPVECHGCGQVRFFSARMMGFDTGKYDIHGNF